VEIPCPSFSKECGIKWMNALPIRAPTANPTRKTEIFSRILSLKASVISPARESRLIERTLTIVYVQICINLVPA
jgi:hypothetical protein